MSLLVQSAAGETKSTSNMVYFYDNDLKNKTNENVCPHIQFNWVDASGNITRDYDGVKRQYTLDWNDRNFSKHDYECIALFEQGSNALKFANYVKRVVGSCAYDPRAGKQVIRADNTKVSFYEHVKHAAALPHITGFVFDWDRTLQVMEGMFGPISLEKWGQYLQMDVEKTTEALSEYHAGGKERLQELRDMFEAIGDKPVVIISASKAITMAARNVYEAVLKSWGCQNLQGLHYSQGKYETMAVLESLSQYCN